MTMNMNNDLKLEHIGLEQSEQLVKPYVKPLLIAYGDVRDITLGPTVGGGESGCAAIFRDGAGDCPTP